MPTKIADFSVISAT